MGAWQECGGVSTSMAPGVGSSVLLLVVVAAGACVASCPAVREPLRPGAPPEDMLLGAAGGAFGAVARYPTIEVPPRVAVGELFDALVSLTEERITDTTVVAGRADERGRVVFDVEHEYVVLDVVLSAPDFAIEGAAAGTITVPIAGDSTAARFRLRALEQVAGRRSLFATFWQDGGYVARVKCELLVGDTSRTDERRAVVQQERPLELAANDADSPERLAQGTDLTIFALHDTGAPGSVELVIASPHFQPFSASVSMPADLVAWLDHHSARVARARGIGRAAPESAKTYAEIRGFGRELYERFAPPPFRAAFWRLVDELGPELDSIQIYSDGMRIPWELLCPVRDNGSEPRDFLGVELAVARWHVSSSGGLLERPPARIPVVELATIAPAYPADRMLPGQARELAALQAFPGFRRVPADFGSVRALFEKPPSGIIHFSGHGRARAGAGGVTDYAIVLEDGELDLATWRGLDPPAAGSPHPFVFFNACDVGQARSFAHKMDGWAPAMLEAGASAFVGALWSIDDEAASAFAETFYARLSESMRVGDARPARILRDIRRLHASTGDPTCLAYVFYGDAQLELVPAAR